MGEGGGGGLGVHGRLSADSLKVLLQGDAQVKFLTLQFWRGCPSLSRKHRRGGRCSVEKKDSRWLLLNFSCEEERSQTACCWEWGMRAYGGPECGERCTGERRPQSPRGAGRTGGKDGRWGVVIFKS